MEHFVEIYRHRGADYHQLIAAEDADGNLLNALNGITPLSGKRIVDLGSGTGRIPILLRESGSQIVSLDLHRGMLTENAKQRAAIDGDWALVQADLRTVPVAGDWADVVCAGWAIGHFNSWYAEAWLAQVGRALKEMKRVARPGGVLIILETMGTGTDEAGPPSPGLRAYYDWLAGRGFQQQVVSSDYDFGSVERAVELTTFFFGEELGEKVAERGWQRVPEWTGLWSLELDRIRG